MLVKHLHTRETTGFQARSRGGRWSWTLKLAQKRSWAGRWSWAAKVGLLSLRVVPQQQCNGHCPCDYAQARQLNGEGTPINTSIVLAAVHGFAGHFRAVSAVESSLFTPPPLSGPISNLASVDVKQYMVMVIVKHCPWGTCSSDSSNPSLVKTSVLCLLPNQCKRLKNDFVRSKHAGVPTASLINVSKITKWT